MNKNACTFTFKMTNIFQKTRQLLFKLAFFCTQLTNFQLFLSSAKKDISSSRCFHGKHLKKSKFEVQNDFESENAKADVNKVLKTRASYFKSLLLHSFALGTH